MELRILIQFRKPLIINKSITLVGEDEDKTFIDGEGTGIVVYITGEDVSITGFTIQNGEYGIFCDESVSTTITYNTITNYVYGIYNNKTTGGYITHNKISVGENGIVTFEAFNDAIRYNTISHNTVYGAKDFNSQLKNCFNWNYFHHNYIAYYYDPDTPLETLEFDGNVIEDNYIGIKVAEASTVSITNNTITRNEYGIYLINASPNILFNYISDAKYGIYIENSSSLILDNVISKISEYGIYAEDGKSLRIINNSLVDGKMFMVDSDIEEIWLEDTILTKLNSNIKNYHLDGTSGIENAWFLYLSVVDEEDKPVSDAAVLIYDGFDNLILQKLTDSNGLVEPTLITENLVKSTDTISYNPYRVVVLKDTFKTAEFSLTIDEDRVGNTS
jgi:parallel beta-helix repeat protein